jgi:hypothetical protein
MAPSWPLGIFLGQLENSKLKMLSRDLTIDEKKLECPASIELSVQTLKASDSGDLLHIEHFSSANSR